MRRTFAHHFSDQLKIEKTISSTSNIMARSFGAFALNQLSLSESRLDWEIAAIKPRGKLQPWSNVASVFLRIWSALTGIHLAFFNKALRLVARKMSPAP